MPLKNPMYDMLLLKKPTREGVASALFGDRTVSMAVPNRQVNAEAIFSAAPSARAAMEGRVSYSDYPSWTLNIGLSGLGAMQSYEILPGLSFKGDSTPEVGEAYKAFTQAKNYGNCAKYSPTWSSWQPLSAGQFQSILSKMNEAESSSDPKAMNRLESWKDRVRVGIRNVESYAAWECFGLDCCSNMECCPRSPAREQQYVAAMKTLKATLLEALSWPQPKVFEPYVEPDDLDTSTSGSTGGRTAQQAYDATFGGRRTGSTSQSRGASTAGGGIPGWALPVAGVALLGILAGGLVFLKKKKG